MRQKARREQACCHLTCKGLRWRLSVGGLKAGRKHSAAVSNMGYAAVVIPRSTQPYRSQVHHGLHRYIHNAGRASVMHTLYPRGLTQPYDLHASWKSLADCSTITHKQMCAMPTVDPTGLLEGLGSVRGTGLQRPHSTVMQGSTTQNRMPFCHVLLHD